MKKISLLNARSIAASAIMLIICFMSTGACFANDNGQADKDKKVTVEYQYVTKDEVSSKEMSHLTKGLPSITAKENAKYLMVYDGNTGKTNTGDSVKLPLWLICLTAGGTAIFVISRKKMNSSKNAKVAILLVAGLVCSIPAAGLMEAKAYTSNKLKKYNFTQTLNIGDKLFQNMPKVEAGTLMGVIDTAELKDAPASPAGNNNPVENGNKKPDVQNPSDTDNGNSKKPDKVRLADKPADGTWYGTAFEGYGPESYGASIVKVEIEGGKIKSAEAIKHCATDVSYIDLAKKLLPLYKGKTVPDLDSIYQELSDKLSSGKKGPHTDAVTSATMTSKGYALAIKNAVERARKFAFDKKEQKIAYIKITGDNISSPGIDRTAVAEKSKLTNGKNADFDFVKYDIMMSNGTLEKEVKFSDLKKYGIEANYKQGETLKSDGKDNIILTVEDETGYASEKIRLHVNPKDERVEVRPTHALITFENSTDTPDTERIDIEKGKIVYDTKKTYNKKIKKVELFRDNKLIKEGEFKPVFNYWWFEIEDKDYNLGDKEKWEFRRYRIVTKINGDLKPGEPSKPDTPEKPKPSIVKNGYIPKTIKIIDKKSKSVIKKFDFEKGDWKNSSNKREWNDISQDIVSANDVNTRIEVEATNESGEKLKINDLKKMYMKNLKRGILTILINNPDGGDDYPENHLVISFTTK
ncbi:hypothetical protein ACGCUQ_06615 [Eubacteriales bacterium KG127]